jgi:hypothetical protein
LYFNSRYRRLHVMLIYIEPTLLETLIASAPTFESSLEVSATFRLSATATGGPFRAPKRNTGQRV